MNEPKRPRHSAVGRALRPWLGVVLLLFALLVVNSAYLAAITVGEQMQQRSLQDAFYLGMFLLHLLLGLILSVPFGVFAIRHLRRAWRRPNRYAARAGLALFASGTLLVLSGLLLTRFGVFEVNHPEVRRAAYWIHVLLPFVVVWLFVLHRLAGPPLHWGVGLVWGAVALSFAVGMLALRFIEPPPPATADARPFYPALTTLAGGQTRIPAERLMTDQTCAECHGEIARQAEQSMHRLSSFNNPAYRASVEETRRVAQRRDGNLQASALCAACHDPAPLFDGRFLRADFDPDQDPTAHAGLTCVACHAITQVNSPRGNGDYTLADPINYPFAFSTQPALRYLNRQLIKAKPELHKATYLKPVHRSAEFCSACHKVHLPIELNHYRWLRGQNHYDSFLQSGVSGHRVDSFYYPAQAVGRCSECHMALTPSSDPAARDFDGSGRLSVHHHGFAAANTAVPQWVGLDDDGNAARRAMLEGSVRVDLFGLRDGGTIEGRLHAPLRPALPVLEPGRHYLLETVVRTLRVGHHLTQGTSDSNELWLEVTVRAGDRLLAHSGARDRDGGVDPTAYFLNAYVLDQDGNRIQRRNAQDIFVPLYDHQIPPGAASVVHYALEVPADVVGPLEIEARVQYRKFDLAFVRFMRDDPAATNDLPIITLASDRVTLPVGDGLAPSQVFPVAAWERWNDYGIGLLRERGGGAATGQMRQAEVAFTEVERLGRGDGPLNLARVYFQEGRLREAAAALQRAADFEPRPAPWTIAWLSALVDAQNGRLDAAIETFEALAQTGFAEARARGFDFGYDTNLLNQLGRTLLERARQARGEARRDERAELLARAEIWLRRALEIDPEHAAAHYNLALAHTEQGDSDAAARHRALHQTYRSDDLAVAHAVRLARSRDPVADHAASPLAIYALGLPTVRAAELALQTEPTE
ncbi:MAG: tetratricopeptide repeat protein [Thiotrichales bacterium]